MLEFCTLFGAPTHRRMQAKAVRVNTQLWGRRLSCARQALQAPRAPPPDQLMRAGALCACASSVAGEVSCSTGVGMISRRNFALGATTQWEQIRCKHGRDIRTATA